MGDLTTILSLALLAMLNPTLLAATTIMMLLPNTKRLMFGYLLGAYLTSILTGVYIALRLSESESVESAGHNFTPGQDLVLGTIILIIGLALRTQRAEEIGERRRRRKEASEKESWPERMLGRGSARVAFAIGALLSFPGLSYLTGLDRIAKFDAPDAVTVLLVVVFCLIQLAMLEVPLLGYAISPDRTQERVTAFRGWIAEHGRSAIAKGAIVVGSLLLLKGVLELIL
jgi:xanthine/uracil permease